MKSVLIDIVSVIKTDEDTDTIELTTVGKMAERDGKWLIIYDETPPDGSQSVHTTLKVNSNDSITLQRTGGIMMKMLLKSGESSLCRYSTAYGDLMVEVYANEVSAKMHNGGGEIRMKYSIDINSGFSSVNEVVVNIKEDSSNYVSDR